MNKTDALPQLLEIMRKLRDPETGCPWDIKQSFHSIAPFTIEEAYEVTDAIERNDLLDLKDELGDLLFQVVFHAQMASELDTFTFDDVAQSIVDKMIRRHPHVFGDTKYSSEAEQKAAWESIKSAERQLKRQQRDNLATDSSPSAVDGIATNLPALKRADKVQKRAARVGFDWPDIQPVWHKLDEEIAELRDAIESGDHDAIEDELGDILFTAVNLARHCSVEPESALRRATVKFERRFRRVESLAATRGKSLDSLDLEGLDALWNEAKVDL